MQRGPTQCIPAAGLGLFVWDPYIDSRHFPANSVLLFILGLRSMHSHIPSARLLPLVWWKLHHHAQPNIYNQIRIQEDQLSNRNLLRNQHRNNIGTHHKTVSLSNYVSYCPPEDISAWIQQHQGFDNCSNIQPARHHRIATFIFI